MQLARPFPRIALATLVAALAGALVAPTAFAQGTAGGAFPSRPVRLVVPFPPGGINDVLARTVAQKMGDQMGQPMVIENRPGAGGTIGSNVVARAPADGYTLLFGATSTVAVSPNLYKGLPYDPVKDFAPIGPLASVASILVVHPAVAARTLPELLALARAKPGSLTFGSAGAGTSQHMGGELLKSLARVDMTHVPYKGGAPAMADLVGGQIAFMIEPVPTALAQMKAGKVRGVAVTTAARLPVASDLPTIAETVAGYDLTIWFGLLAPAGTPREVVARLSSELGAAVRSADVRERFAAQGADPMSESPEQFGAFIRREIGRWGEVVRVSGARVD